MDKSLAEMVGILESHGARHAWGDVRAVAQDWIDHDFDACGADGWCDIGVWDPATAAEFRAAGLTPGQIADASETLARETDGDPIYAACNGDICAQVIIDAAKDGEALA